MIKMFDNFEEKSSAQQFFTCIAFLVGIKLIFAISYMIFITILFSFILLMNCC
jgi:hypothetical protein